MKHWPIRAREKRFDIAARTIIETADGWWAEATVLNVSNGGCRIATRKILNVGEEIRLEVEPLGYVSAKVAWTCFEGAGLTFVVRFDSSPR